MLVVADSRFRKQSEQEKEDEPEIERSGDEPRGTYADFRELENELFLQHARGLRDASRRLVKK